MTLRPIKDMNEFKRLKKSLQNTFDSEQSGYQVFQKDQTITLKSLIDVQKETSKLYKIKLFQGKMLTLMYWCN